MSWTSGTLKSKRHSSDNFALSRLYGDPGGVADVVGIHYPNEFPSRRLWPNDAFWMEEPRFITDGGGMFWDNKPFFWDR
ncbi:hypothetical protein B0813_001480 [Candidatus Fervidibacteria bacterium JGI MDM2 SSWTFF-3-K9]